jgi:hypothetical protein
MAIAVAAAVVSERGRQAAKRVASDALRLAGNLMAGETSLVGRLRDSQALVLRAPSSDHRDSVLIHRQLIAAKHAHTSSFAILKR